MARSAQASQVQETRGRREMRYVLGCGTLHEIFGLTPA
jgi:hypothetical protein